MTNLHVEMEEEELDDFEPSPSTSRRKQKIGHKRKRGDDDDEGDEGGGGATGLADVMSKILGSTKPKKKASKAIILSRAKKDTVPVDKQGDAIKPPKRPNEKKADLKLENLNRVKPDPGQDLNLERQLTKIATQGVVRLFNAVTVQQKVGNIKREGKAKSGKSKLVTKEEGIQQFDKIISQSRDT